MCKTKVIFHWSGGKDSALALHRLLQNPDYKVVGLVTTINEDSYESTLHKIPTCLIETQAREIGLPIEFIHLKAKSGMESYDNAMRQLCIESLDKGVSHFAFGDIYLEEIITYRYHFFKEKGIKLIQPLLNSKVEDLFSEFLNAGFRTIITTVTNPKLKQEVGVVLDHHFKERYPVHLDLCGENGEYHTFCFDGPIFSKPISFSLSESQEENYSFEDENGKVQHHCYWFSQLHP